MKQAKYTAGLFLTSVSVFTSLTGLQRKQNIKLGTFFSCTARNTNTNSDHRQLQKREETG